MISGSVISGSVISNSTNSGSVNNQLVIGYNSQKTVCRERKKMGIMRPTTQNHKRKIGQNTRYKTRSRFRNMYIYG